MADKRKHNGGHSTKPQREDDKRLLTRAEELQANVYATDAITKEYGSVEAFWEFIASQSRDSKDHLKMILEYAFGKAPDKVDVTSGGDKITGVTYVVKRRD
jgi:hypothetical protein